MRVLRVVPVFYFFLVLPVFSLTATMEYNGNGELVIESYLTSGASTLSGDVYVNSDYYSGEHGVSSNGYLEIYNSLYISNGAAESSQRHRESFGNTEREEVYNSFIAGEGFNSAYLSVFHDASYSYQYIEGNGNGYISSNFADHKRGDFDYGTNSYISFASCSNAIAFLESYLEGHDEATLAPFLLGVFCDKNSNTLNFSANSTDLMNLYLTLVSKYLEYGISIEGTDENSFVLNTYLPAYTTLEAEVVLK